MLTRTVRNKFLEYFKKRGHTLVPSSPTVPDQDPTLLFVNAGMNQFKEIFLGRRPKEDRRVVSAQKCIRVGGKHNDLDHVGHTQRHMTFFEMLGNFSFGDYFKKEAITFAFEFAASVLNFPEERLFVSVHKKDDEAYELWKMLLDEKKISRMGDQDNFWSMGETGPCGPCSELFFDLGSQCGSASAIHEDVEGKRFLEFWNLVFMQFEKDESGRITPLAEQSVDTGAGLERILMLMMGASNVFQTEIFKTLIEQIESVAGKKYSADDKRRAPAFYVIADHIRSLAFAIADGAHPSNTERGYILRKILRRAVRYGRVLGLHKPFLAQILPTLIEIMGEDFHELKVAEPRIAEILTVEEESFFHTLSKGETLLSSMIDQGKMEGRKEISGEEAFKLKDTFGFPLDEILLIAKDAHLPIDLDKYHALEKEAKERSRQLRKKERLKVEKSLYESAFHQHGGTEFVGYREMQTKATIKGLIVDGSLVDTMRDGQEGVVILDRSPFYAEKGGQVGDSGKLEQAKARFIVTDCQTPYPGVIAHMGFLEGEAIKVEAITTAQVNADRRFEIAKHHTATHLLHYALQKVLGPHIRQAGSLVEPNRLRFDFNHHKALSREEIRGVEQLVNAKIWENKNVKTYEIPFEEASKDPQIKKFFEDKYEKKVRVVDIDSYSKELCGGTHVKSLAAIGLFCIAKETGIAKGIRRIEALTGFHAEGLRDQLENRIALLSRTLKSSPSNLAEAAESLIKENAHLKEQVTLLRKKELSDLTQSLATKTQKVNGVTVLNEAIEVGKKGMLELGQNLIKQLESGIVLLHRKESGRCHLLLLVSSDLIARGIHANALIKQLADQIGGSGGGKKGIAHAGGSHLEGVSTLFDVIKGRLKTNN